MVETSLSAGVVATLLLEFFKWLYRKFVVKNMLFDFPKWVYIVSIPVLGALLVPALAFLGLEGYFMPSDWTAFVKNIVIVAISSAASLLTYVGVKPLKGYTPSVG